jgi:SNF2 family DNA or RNA helicase
LLVQVDELRKLVGPHMLRRVKKGLLDIPAKREIMLPVELSTLQV